MPLILFVRSVVTFWHIMFISKPGRLNDPIQMCEKFTGDFNDSCGLIVLSSILTQIHLDASDTFVRSK